jgi:hypothetical protein
LESFLPFWIRIRNLYADPDPTAQINADPDPKPWLCPIKVNFRRFSVPGKSIQKTLINSGCLTTSRNRLSSEDDFVNNANKPGRSCLVNLKTSHHIPPSPKILEDDLPRMA